MNSAGNQFLFILTDVYYHYHNRIPVQAWVLHLSSFKVVEWYELLCDQFAHTYSTLWGKENETHEIQ